MHILLGFGIGWAVAYYGDAHGWSTLKVFVVAGATALSASFALSYVPQVLTK